jgi:SAM-dependent methyltransferase
MESTDNTPRLYQDLAEWWPVLSSPADYAEEAAFYHESFESCSRRPIHTLLELGCGGGNNASHLKAFYQLTLVDLSPGMLGVSKALNPECEHLQGDMRSIRLGRIFDAVFIHDSIMYMTNFDDLSRAIETAFVHCASGGVALFSPDCVRETFQESTDHGGHDLGSRSLRYLEWIFDPDPNDTIFESHMVYLMREDGQPLRCVFDRHLMGLFSRTEWLELIRRTGFTPLRLPFLHSELKYEGDVFMGLKTKT